MGWALLLLSAWVTASGLAGVFLQKWIPAALSEGLRVEALFERIPSLVEGLLDEADELDGRGEREPGGLLPAGGPGAACPGSIPRGPTCFDVRAGRDRALEPFRRMAQFVPAEEKAKVSDLMEIYIEKLELDAQHRMQQVLRHWLVWTRARARGRAPHGAPARPHPRPGSSTDGAQEDVGHARRPAAALRVPARRGSRASSWAWP